jgi:pyrroloquinoline-quinone synthase
LKTQGTLDRLDQLISSRSILEHPFYQAWNAGELTRDQLRTYARIYYPHVAAFPGYLRTAAERATDPAIQHELEDNLREELTEPKAHDELWLDFATGLGMDRESVMQAPVHPAARAAVSQFDELAHGTTGAAVAALYAYESQQPEVSRTKADGLRDLYKVDDQATVAYFEVHTEADVRHRQGEREALARCLEEGATEQELLAATDQALDAYWGLLDGVCEETGI